MTRTDPQTLLAELREFRARLDDLPEDLRPPLPASPPGRILAATRGLLAEGGLENLTVRLVAERAGVNPAAINYYFQTKDNLIHRTLCATMLEVLGETMGALLAEGSPEEVLARHPGTLVGTLRKDPVRLALLRRVISSDPGRLQAAVLALGQHGLLGARDRMLGLIGALQAEGRVRQVPPQSVLLLLLAVAYGLVVIAELVRVMLGFDLQDDGQWDGLRTDVTDLLRGALGVNDEPEARP